MILDSKIPSGPLEKKWNKHIMDGKLVNPANKRKYEVIVVGTGLAGAIKKQQGTNETRQKKTKNHKRPDSQRNSSDYKGS